MTFADVAGAFGRLGTGHLAMSGQAVKATGDLTLAAEALCGRNIGSIGTEDLRRWIEAGDLPVVGLAKPLRCLGTANLAIGGSAMIAAGELTGLAPAFRRGHRRALVGGKQGDRRVKADDLAGLRAADSLRRAGAEQFSIVVGAQITAYHLVVVADTSRPRKL